MTKNLQFGFIEPSSPPSASPVGLVPRRDSKRCVYDEYRRENAGTIRDNNCIPYMEDWMDSLCSAEVLSILDCNWGYWQIQLKKSDRNETTFVRHSGTYRYHTMSFGLTKAPATFQRPLYIVLASCKCQTSLVYIDNIIILSDGYQIPLWTCRADSINSTYRKDSN